MVEYKQIAHDAGFVIYMTETVLRLPFMVDRLQHDFPGMLAHPILQDLPPLPPQIFEQVINPKPNDRN
jgi:hypothetical protein